jgi:hypothetical protein
MEKIGAISARSIVGVLALCSSSYAFAELQVYIKDGIPAHDKLPPASYTTPFGQNGSFNLSATLMAGTDLTMPLLRCSQRPCTVYFPSGQITSDPNTDLFAFSDDCTSDCDTRYASVSKTENFATADVAQIQLKNLRVTALSPNARNVHLIYEITKDTDMKRAGSGSGKLDARPELSGRFTNDLAADSGVSAACTVIFSPCARLLTTFNGAPLNGKWQVALLQSVTIPCKMPDSVSPCYYPWPGGYYNDGTGSFKTYDLAEVTCPTCAQLHTGWLAAAFSKPQQTLTIENSRTLLSLKSEEEFGLVNLAKAATSDAEHDAWFAYSRAKNDSPLVTLTSIGSADKILSRSDQLRNDRSYIAYVTRPKALKWGELEHLILEYEVVTVPSFSGDPRLGKLPFSDCQNNSFYIKVDLVNAEGADAGYLIIRLGGKPPEFTAGCASASVSKDVLKDPQPRVDAKKLGQEKLITVKQSRTDYGSRYVRSISIVVDRGTAPSDNNYKVRVLSAQVGDIKALHENIPIIGTIDEPLE